MTWEKYGEKVTGHHWTDDQDIYLIVIEYAPANGRDMSNNPLKGLEYRHSVVKPWIEAGEILRVRASCLFPAALIFHQS